MAKPKAKEVDVDDVYSPEAIEVMVDYVKGNWNLENAARELHKLTGLLPEYGKVLLRAMRTGRPNVTMVRGYEKTPEKFLPEREKRLGRPVRK